MVALLDTAGRVDLELESFEKIPAGDHYSLFRVDGRWVLAPGTDAPTPTLVVQRGARRDRFEPLPGGADDFRHDDGRAWSAGYAVPLDLILDARVRFWLEADGPRYPLGSPEDRELYEGREAQVVVRNGRPHLLLAAGLMAVAISPLVAAAPAGAQTAATGPTGPTGATGTVDPIGTTGPTGPSGTVAPVAAPVEGVTKTAKKHANRAEHRAHAKAKAKHRRKHEHRRTAAPAKHVTSTIRPALDPTPHVTPVPSPLQQSFAVPPFLLPIYQAAATEYGVPWTVLAAINQVETNFGRNLNVSSAGAQGWMQFMPSTWDMYGVDTNLDGRRDPSNPADAIFAAARYLRAAGADKDVRRAIFAYNHAGWYVDSVMAKARALDKLPQGAVAALTGLAIGRFPVPGPHVTYTQAVDGWVATGEATAQRTAAQVNGPAGRDVVTPSTVRVLYLGRSRNGVFAVLEDAYGNRFTYGHLAHLVRHFARTRTQRPSASDVVRQLRLDAGAERVAYHPAPEAAASTWPSDKERLYAHPARDESRSHGGAAQMDAAPRSVLAAAARRLGVRPASVVMARLRPGAVVPAGTVIGRLGGAVTSHGRAHVIVRIRPAGGRAHEIDPAPILEAWRLAARGAMGPTSAKTKDGQPLTLGRTMLLSDRQLGRMVLGDDRVRLTHAGRDDVRSGLVDRRVLVSLEALADAGVHPSVSALRSGSTTDATRDLGRGFEIVALNGDQLAAHRTDSSTASQALRVLRSLPAPLAPRHATLDPAAQGTTAIAASTSTAEGRLVVGFPRRPHSSRAITRAVNAMLLGGSPIVAGAQGAGAPDVSHAPQAVKQIAAGADAIAGLPYVWGGGHGSWDAGGYDCSGSVSYALHAAGLLDAPLTSGELAGWGEAGPGEHVTIYANPTHVIMEIEGQFYGTSGFGHPETGGGPGWFSLTPSPEYLANFTVRHPAGL
jgi:membrane-bound lytic murein transglycosylase B/cell wall-associated NlpC family hydrolase